MNAIRQTSGRRATCRSRPSARLALSLVVPLLAWAAAPAAAQITGTLSSGIGAPSPVTGVSAGIAGAGAVRVTWQASPTAGVTQYQVSRRVNGGLPELLNTVGASTLTYLDTFFPATLFASGAVRVSYIVVALASSGRSAAAITGELTVQPPTATTAPASTPCTLQYQRADNMWAAFGRPDGPLGTETVSLFPGQDKVFVTDWKYEKTRNDGTNYYGSHLRVATNPTSHTVRIQLRTLTLTGLIVLYRTGSNTFWTRLDPGMTKQFQADLMEVFCEK